jgi:general secretion pathway protein B
MSFILDALKKLEQKRREGSVPDLLTTHTPRSERPQKRPIWPYLLVTALLLNAGILTVWLQPWKSKTHDTFVQVIPEQQENILKEPEKTTSDMQKTLSSSPEKEEIEEAPTPEIKSDQEKATAVVKTTEELAPDEETEDKKTALLDLNLSERELDILRSKIKEERSSLADYSPEDNQLDEIKVPESTSEVLELSQLPLDIRKELPEILIFGHIYSNDPSSRLVNINGSIIREGEKVTSGLKVVEITMNGVIFDYQGIRFRMRAF